MRQPAESNICINFCNFLFCFYKFFSFCYYFLITQVRSKVVAVFIECEPNENVKPRFITDASLWGKQACYAHDWPDQACVSYLTINAHKQRTASSVGLHSCQGNRLDPVAKAVHMILSAQD